MPTVNVPDADVRPTEADRRLEVAALRQLPRASVELELRARMARVEQTRDLLRTRLLELLRYADRAATVHGDAFALEALGQTERELLALRDTVLGEAGRAL